MAVANGKVDAAAVADRIFDSAVNKGLVKREDFQIVWRSQPIPESPMTWRKNLDAGTKQKVAAALAEVRTCPGVTRACSTASRPRMTRPTTWCARRPRP